MVTGAADPEAPTRARRLRFDRYVLDLDRGSLLLDGKEIALRPKTFSVLLHLVEDPNRLVSKEELFAAAWPNVAVTDDALVQSIGELRRALGDDGPRLIKTIPRRGYRFESEVSADPAIRQRADAPSSTVSHAEDQIFAPEFKAPVPRPLFTASHWVAVAICAALAVGGLWLGAARERSIFGFGDATVVKNAPIGAKPAIAILPFENQSEDRTRDY